MSEPRDPAARIRAGLCPRPFPHLGCLNTPERNGGFCKHCEELNSQWVRDFFYNEQLFKDTIKVREVEE